MSELAVHPQQKKRAAHLQQKNTRPPGWPAHAPLGSARPPGAWAGQPGGAFFFFFGCGCAASLLTHSLPTSEHPLQKEIQGPRLVFFFAAGARAHSFTRCLQPGAATAKKHPQQKKRHAPAAKKTGAHPQQKKINKKRRAPAAKKNAPRTRSKKEPTTKI